jgi:hypothetical protein
LHIPAMCCGFTEAAKKHAVFERVQIKQKDREGLEGALINHAQRRHCSLDLQIGSRNAMDLGPFQLNLA